MWSDIAALTFAAVAMNHLGLIETIERVTGRRLIVANCPKCLTFWSTLAYQVVTGSDCIAGVAISFACAWLAVWLELGMGYTDQLFDRVYERIYTKTTAAHQTSTRTADTDGAEDTMP